MTVHFQAYAEGLHHEFGMYATWLPDARIELGDVGLMHNGHFERVTSLAKKGLTFDVRESSGRARHQHMSSNVREVNAGTNLATIQPGASPSLGGKSEGCHSQPCRALGRAWFPQRR